MAESWRTECQSLQTLGAQTGKGAALLTWWGTWQVCANKIPAKRHFAYNLMKEHQEKLSLTANRWREQASTGLFLFFLEIKSDVVSLALLVAWIAPILWLWLSCRAISYSHKLIRGGLFPIHISEMHALARQSGRSLPSPRGGVSRSSLTNQQPAPPESSQKLSLTTGN